MQALRFLMKTLLWIFGTVFTLALIVAIAVTVVWFHPNLILKDSLIRKALTKQTFLVFPDGLPTEISVTMKNERTWSQAITVSASPFCVEAPSFGIDACLRVLHLEATVRLSRRGIGLERVGPIEVDLKNIRKLPVVAKAPEPEPTKSGGWPELFLVPNLNLQPVHLVVDRGRIESKTRAGVKDDQAIRFAGELRLSDSDYEDEKFSFFANWKADLPFDPKHVSLKGEGTVSYDEVLTAALRLDAPHSGNVPGAKLSLDAEFSLKTLQGELVGKGELTQVIALLPKIEIQEFRLRRRETLDFSAKLSGDLAIGAPVSPYRHAMPAPVFKTHIDAAAHGAQDKQGDWKLGLDIVPIKQYGSILSARLRASYGKELKIEESKVDFRISEFHETVKGLSRTQWAVITPFNSLRGPVSLTIGDPDEKRGGMPLRFESNLSSRVQKFVTHADGVIKLSPTHVPDGVDVKFVLDEVTLQAPAVNPVVPIPKVMGDSRIITPSMGIGTADALSHEEMTTGAATSSAITSARVAEREDRRALRGKGIKPPPRKKKSKVGDSPTDGVKQATAKEEKSAFPWALEIETGAEPVRIIYELFKPAAPFRVKGKVSSEEPAKFVFDFDPMTIEFLKRRADVDFLKVRLADALRVDGRLSIKRADCTIFATLHKDGDDTSFTLKSEPEFSEDEIVSMLLFNERASDLDDNSKRSVEDTQQALRRKSLGFFSFFVLASTPVESVAYDPTTKVYSARVRLPGGISATVGSDWDKTQSLDLMKRLGGKWILSVGTSTDNVTGQSKQESMIEWWNRY